MAAIEITVSGVLFDKYARTARPVVLIGEASITGVGVGGGPIVPPDQPPGIWGPTDPRPSNPIPIYPGGTPTPPGIWGPTDPRPTNPISGIPGLPGYEPPPTTVPPGEPDGDGFIKAPPPDGGWGYHVKYGWMLDPRPGDAGPK